VKFAAPAVVWAMPIIRPSTCAGTPDSMLAGGVPRRSGHAARTRSWLPPIPPEVTMTACARNSNSPAAVREDETPRVAFRDRVCQRRHDEHGEEEAASAEE